MNPTPGPPPPAHSSYAAIFPSRSPYPDYQMATPPHLPPLYRKQQPVVVISVVKGFKGQEGVSSISEVGGQMGAKNALSPRPLVLHVTDS